MNEKKEEGKKLTLYHCQISFAIKEHFILPHFPQLGHISWKQQSLFHSQGHVAPNATVEVPE